MWLHSFRWSYMGYSFSGRLSPAMMCFGWHSHTIWKTTQNVVVVVHGKGKWKYNTAQQQQQQQHWHWFTGEYVRYVLHIHVPESEGGNCFWSVVWTWLLCYKRRVGGWHSKNNPQRRSNTMWGGNIKYGKMYFIAGVIMWSIHCAKE